MLVTIGDDFKANTYALHSNGKIDKSIELFRLSANLNDEYRSSLKLKCEFNLGSKLNANPEDSLDDASNLLGNENKSDINNLKPMTKIKWTKLNSDNFNLVKTFEETNNDEMSDVSSSSSTSELQLKFRNSLDFYSAAGIYLCQLSNSSINGIKFK